MPGLLGEGALLLDGDGDHAATAGPVVNTSRSFTVAGWVSPAGGRPATRSTIFSQSGEVNSGFIVRFDPEAFGGVGAYEVAIPTGDTAGAVEQATQHSFRPPAFGWDHVAIVYDAARDQVRLYVNGRLEQRADGTRSVRDGTVGFTATGPLQIGRAKIGGTFGEYWPGQIDDVWAFQGVLSDTDIQRLADFFTELETGSVPLP